MRHVFWNSITYVNVITYMSKRNVPFIQSLINSLIHTPSVSKSKKKSNLSQNVRKKNKLLIYLILFFLNHIFQEFFLLIFMKLNTNYIQFSLSSIFSMTNNQLSFSINIVKITGCQNNNRHYTI